MKTRKAFSISKIFKYIYSTDCTPGGNTPYNGQYGEAPPEGGAFFKLAVYKAKHVKDCTFRTTEPGRLKAQEKCGDYRKYYFWLTFGAKLHLFLIAQVY